MKVYTNHTRIGLLIGLLSFNALFACVNTKQGLGINTKSYGLAAALMATGAAAMNMKINTNQTNRLSVGNNRNSTTTIAALRSTDDDISTIPSTTTGLPYNMTTTEAAFMLNATETNPAYLLPNGTHFDLATNETSNSGLEGIKTPKFTDKKIADDLVKHGFSTERLTYWLNKGLDPNTVGPTTGSSLLGKLIMHGKTDQVRLLLFRGADPNIEDASKLTPLLISVLSVFSGRLTEDEAIDMIYILIGYGADPCIESGQGSTVKSCINNINSYFAHKQQWDKVAKKLFEEMKRFNCPNAPVKAKYLC